MAVTLGKLAQLLGATLHGDAQCEVERVAGLDEAGAGELSFLSDARYRGPLAQTKAAAVILRPSDVESCPVNALALDDPYLGYAKATVLLHPWAETPPGIADSAVISDQAVLDPSVSVGPHCVIDRGVTLAAGVVLGAGTVIGPDVSIGERTQIGSNVSVCAGTIIGKRGVIHPGAVLGADGFGLAKEGDHWLKIPQLGVVKIGDDVEIGANTTIDRGALGDTCIDDGVKIDNLVHVGHNSRIGENTAIAGCVGISGSSIIGRRCSLGGQVGIAGHLEIVDDVTILGTTLVSKSITRKGVYSGAWPFREAAAWRKFVATLHRLGPRPKSAD